MKYLTFLIGALVSTGAYAGKYQLDSFTGVEIVPAKTKVVMKSGDVEKSSDAISRRILYKVVLNSVFIKDVLETSYGEGNPVETLTSKANKTLEVPSAYLRAMEELAEIHQFDGYQYLGPLEPSLMVWLTSEAAEKLRIDPRLYSLEEVDAHRDTVKSEASPAIIAGDVTGPLSAEVTSWGVAAVNAAGATNGQYNNLIYVVDGLSDGMHPGAANDLNMTFVKNSLSSGTYAIHQKLHTAHVMGIIGAKKNGINVAGVNPNQPIMLIAADESAVGQNTDGDIFITDRYNFPDRDNVVFGMDFAALDAEARGVYSTLNVSYNGSDFDYDKPNGHSVRRASNRFLVVESAGNNSSDACNFAFNNKKDNDGVVVVGGTKQNGTKFVEGDKGLSGIGSGYYGSNYGPCVDLWAPGFNITSLDFSDGKTRVSTGTSFAAPFTAAVASRWGENTTRPIIREQLLKLHSVSGAEGKHVKYGTQYVGDATKSLPVFKISALGSTADLPGLRNSKHYQASDAFNFPGSTGTLVAELGGVSKNIFGVRLTLSSTAEGKGQNTATFKVYGSNDGVNYILIGMASENKYINWGPVFVPTNMTAHKFLKIEGNNPTSKLGYYEVEVYGN